MKKKNANTNKPLRYLVYLRRTGTGFSADVPDLPGCVAAAGSLRSAKKLIAEAIGWHIDLMKQSGDKIPKPSRAVEFSIDEDSQEDFCTWVEVIMPRELARVK